MQACFLVCEKMTMVGERFGRLVVIGMKSSSGKRLYMDVRCDCGTSKAIRRDHLRAGKINSCGCLQRESTGNRRRTHGRSGTHLAWVYSNIIQRCTNRARHDFARYGGKGIGVCDEWLGDGGLERFATWALSNGYENGLQIDRKDNSLGYSQDNCHFVTPTENNNNREITRFVVVAGVKMPLADAARNAGININTLAKRIDSGWPIDRAMSEPINENFSRRLK